VALAIFDLDNTLLAGDSDHAWGEFLVEQRIVDPEYYKQQNDKFYADYQAGTLDIFEFLSFTLAPLAQHPKEKLFAWRERFLADKIAPMILKKSLALVDSHRQRGDTLLIITATNRFITEPIAARLGIDNLIATEPEENESGYTGQPVGVPSYQEGKITRLKSWLE